jgi:pimeloyl-ACP methyl ester carboxylesterase
MDLAGHGESGDNRDDWTMEAYGLDVAAVVDAIGAQDVILIGHSMGGAVVFEAARHLQGRVKALIGVDTFQDMGRHIEDSVLDGWLAPFDSNFAATTIGWVSQMFSETADSALIDRVTGIMAAANPEVAIPSIRAVINYPYTEKTVDPPIPVRCVNATVNPTNIEGNQAIAGSFEARFMEGVGHFLHMEQPDSFNVLLHETIREFWPEEQH